MSGSTFLPGYRPCVGVMLLNREGLVWIGRRADAPTEPEGPGHWWQMPQGGIDEHEDPRAAAIRELHEETGIGAGSIQIIAENLDWLYYDLPASLQGKAWGGRYKGQRQKWLAARFLGDDREFNIKPVPPHQIEFDAWRWAPIDELTSLIVPFKRPVYEEVVRVFRALAVPT
jgi:putative (di)nucleoside polyphosphate hydrolase